MEGMTKGRVREDRLREWEKVQSCADLSLCAEKTGAKVTNAYR